MNGQAAGGDVKYQPQAQQPTIKPDPDAPNASFPQFPQQGNGQPGFNPHAAQQRAAGILHREFGQGAQASIQAGMQQQPSGGLALPGQAHNRNHPPTGLQLPGPYRPPNQQGQNGGSNLGNSQMDGAGDEDDEDAINSDLDDSEDELQNDESEDQNVSEVMVCVYDKVARVKNKWKCTLKDGILTTNGKE
jgi:transcription initiation factor TFIIA large subunit